MAEVVALGHGRYRISDGGRVRTAYAAAAAEGCWVFIDGQVWLIPPGRLKPPPTTSTDVGTGFSRPGGSSTDDALALSSPMPATVTSIHVTPGQTVARGDLLVMLEAMKMEMPIRAPRDGRIRSIACRPAELVQPGVPLVELES